MGDFSAVKIAELREETPLALHARVEGLPAALEKAYRSPGAVLFLRAGGAEPGPVWLSSPPGRPYFEFLVEKATPWGGAIAGLGRGAEVEVSPPAGRGVPVFDFRRHDVYLLGHGAGLGPIRAIVLHMLTERGAFDRVRVIAEARFLDEIPYRDDFPAWQRAGVRIYQTIARPDVGKWKRTEQAYAHDLFRDLAPEAARAVAIACGPVDFLQGVQGALRALRLSCERVFFLEHEPTVRERPREPERPEGLLAKISKEGVFGSGHQKDVPDHAPGHATPREQPKSEGLAPYQRR
jgi:NAD(P)H-flavin reductase